MTGFDSRACDQMNPAPRAITTAGPYRFEPATITASYPPGRSGGVYRVRSLATADGEIHRGTRCYGEWLVRDRQGRACGAVVDTGAIGASRWSWQRIRQAGGAHQGSDELAPWIQSARSFPALLEKIAG